MKYYLVQKKIYSYILLIISFLYVGSSAENFSSICLLLLSLLIIYHILTSQIKLRTKFWLDKEVVAFLACLLAFLIMVFAPGNKIRRSFFPTSSMTDIVVISIQSLEFLLSDLMYKKSLVLVILSFPFIYVGVLCRERYFKNGLKFSRWLLVGSVLFIAFLWVTLLPNSYAVSWGAEPRRSLTHVSFYIVCFICFFYFLAGYQLPFDSKTALVLSILSCIVIIIYSFKFSIFNITETTKYVRSQDKMIEQLIRLQRAGNRDIVYLDPLYSSEGVVFIRNNILLGYINQCITKGLNLEYPIELKKTSSTETDDR